MNQIGGTEKKFENWEMLHSYFVILNDSQFWRQFGGMKEWVISEDGGA